MIHALDIKEALLELGEYRHSFGKISLDTKLCENIYVYSAEKKGCGLVRVDGKILLPPICESFNILDEDLILVTKNRSFGVFDLKSEKFVVPCINDYIEISLFENKVEYIDFYQGINSYTFGVGASRGSYFLNPHLSKYMLDLLEKKPEMFLSLKSDYFKEGGRFNFHNVELCKKSMEIGIKNKTEEMIAQGQSVERTNRAVDYFYSQVESKIRKEREEVRKDKEIAD